MPEFKQGRGYKMKGFPKIGGTGKKIRVSDKYKAGDNVSEDDFESKFGLKTGDPSTFPQTSVQDYSTVKVDQEGPYVVKLDE